MRETEIKIATKIIKHKKIYKYYAIWYIMVYNGIL